MPTNVKPSCWIRPSWRLTGVATMQPTCPPGWVGDANPFYSQEALDAAVAEERQYWKDAAEAMALEAEYKIGGGAVADWLRSLVAKRGK